MCALEENNKHLFGNASIDSARVCVWTENFSLKFNVPPNLFDIIYKNDDIHLTSWQWKIHLYLADIRRQFVVARCHSYMNFFFLTFFLASFLTTFWYFSLLVWDFPNPLQLVSKWRKKKKFCLEKVKVSFLGFVFHLIIPFVLQRTKLIIILQLLWKHHFYALFIQMPFHWLIESFAEVKAHAIFKELKILRLWNFDSMASK